MTEESGAQQQQTRRFLVEVRGLLQIEARSGDAANRAAEAWIRAVAQSGATTADTALEPVRVGWLRIHPQSDDLAGWPPEAGEEGT